MGGEHVVFKGMHEHNMDTKGRVFIPTKFREGLGDCFVACEAFYTPCIWLFSQSAFDALSEKMEAFGLLDEESQCLERKLYNSACDVEVDKQGRILLPSQLRDYAGLEKEIIIAGSRTHVDVWSRNNWEHQREFDNEAFGRAVSRLRERGVRF